MTDQKSGAEQVRWNLEHLFSSRGELEEALERCRQKADRFSSLYRDRVAQLDPEGISAALQEFEALQDSMGRAHTYASLHWTTHTEDPEAGALLQKVREEVSRISQSLLFFEIELIRLSKEEFQRHLEHETGYRHYLETLYAQRDHILSEPEEKILNEKSVTGSSAWNRFFDETLGAVRFEWEGGQVTEQEILSKLYSAERAVRKRAADSFTRGLETRLRTLTYVFNTRLADKASDDRLRRYPTWLSSRNQSNEISDEAVESLVRAVTEQYNLVGRYYELKRDLLGLEVLYDYDRYAPIGNLAEHFSWEDAKSIVLRAYGRFHQEMERIAEKFFAEEWIDAAVYPGKRSGAFSHPAVPQVHPYILMNYTSQARDVQTLAHELGHGVHQYLAREQGSLQSGTPLTTAEMASVFGEMLVFDALMEEEQDEKNRLKLLISSIDDSIATVFRQIAMNRFEDAIHRSRRAEGELSSERLSEFWMETQQEMFQGSVELREDYAIWWSYIPHFIHTPGYVYAYAFGELLVLALYRLYKEGLPGFAEKYLEILRAGGADWPHHLLRPIGIDLEDPGFWAKGLAEIRTRIDQAEKLKNRVHPS